MAIKDRITAERLRELMQYDPKTGQFTWRVKIGCGQAVRQPGDTAGSINRCHGYAEVGIFGARYRLHILAWLYMTGEWPSELVDHRNMIRSDNRWENLRSATHSQNHGNSRRRSDNKSGLKGVYRRSDNKAWVAQISVRGHKRALGSFDCVAAAHFKYLVEADKGFGEFARAS